MFFFSLIFSVLSSHAPTGKRQLFLVRVVRRWLLIIRLCARVWVRLDDVMNLVPKLKNLVAKTVHAQIINVTVLNYDHF
jgi:hypothetical protein